MSRPGQSGAPGANPDLRRDQPDSSTTVSLPAAETNGRGMSGGAGADSGTAYPSDRNEPVARTVHPRAAQQPMFPTEIVPQVPPVGAPGLGSFAEQPGGLPPRPGEIPGAHTAGPDRPTGRPAGGPAAGGPPPGRRPSVPRPARRAQLTLRRVNVWSVFKFSCILSITLFFVWIIGVGVLYGVIDAAGVVKSINDAVGTVNGTTSTAVIKVGTVFGVAAIIGAVNIVLFIALATIFGVIYNLCADLVGGIEVTLSERE